MAETTAKTVKKVDEKAERKAYLDELVPIMLFKDNDKYSQDLFVSINDKTWLIQRGKQVMIQRYVALHIQEMQEQDMSTAAMIAELSGEYSTRQKEGRI